MTKTYYEVIVQNIGRVYEGTSKSEAMSDFDLYVGKSKREEGRASGECVDLYENGELIKEYTGHNTILKDD